MTHYTVEYVDAGGEIHETTIRADSEDDALELFAERRPDVTATIAYERERMSYDAEAHETASRERAIAAADIVSYLRYRLHRLPEPMEADLRSCIHAYDAAEAAMDRALGLPEAKP